MNIIGKNIKFYRELIGLERKELADKAKCRAKNLPAEVRNSLK